MKVLLDTCVSHLAKPQLQAAGHDVVWVGDEPDPGDEEILKRAHSEGRVLITLDKDFGTLAILHNQPHCGIVRLAGVPSARQGLVCLQALQDYGADLESGAIITVQRHKTRKRQR